MTFELASSSLKYGSEKHISLEKHIASSQDAATIPCCHITASDWELSIATAKTSTTNSGGLDLPTLDAYLQSRLALGKLRTRL